MLLNKHIAGALGGTCWDLRYSDIFKPAQPDEEEEVDEEELGDAIISNIKQKVRGY